MPSGIPPRYAERKRNIRQLESLKANLARSHGYILPTLRYARYPLVGFQDHDSGLDVQVVASNDTSLSRDIMNDYMKQYPYLRQLYILVKVMFEVRGLTDVFRGGFGSYPLFMMIVASIKHHPHRNNDAAGALINFLHFYGTFNTTEYGISIDPVEIFEKAKDPIMSEPVKNKLEVRTTLPTYHNLISNSNQPTGKQIQTPPRVSPRPPRSRRRNQRCGPQRHRHKTRPNDIQETRIRPPTRYQDEHPPFAARSSCRHIVHAQQGA